MDKQIYELHAKICKSLSSPIRLEALDLLREGERSVKDMIAATGTSQPNLSLHLKQMWENGVLARRQEGSVVYYRVSDPEVFDAIDIFRRILSKKLSREHQLAKGRVRR